MKDLQLIKNIPLVDLAQSYGIDLIKKTGNEYCAPCPICGGSDRFVIDGDKNMWFCRQAINHRSNGDSIQLVMEIEHCDFYAACDWLAQRVLPLSAPQPKHAINRPTFDTAFWQNMVDKNAHYMNSYSAQGKYVMNRGISIETAKEFKLGGSYAHGELAIALPYYDWNNNLVGGKWRIINPTENKYHVWKGSNVRCGFGWHTIKGADTLFVVEGELNAVSIHECDPSFDVLSMGSENSHVLPEVAERLTNYKRLILWADSERAIERWTKGIPNYTHTFVTVTKNGVKYDANACLKQNWLANVLARLSTGELGLKKPQK